ncbi:MAG: RagB/SusD family nutrient uptake outer membrane protein, partial [Lentimicrobium sp.]|nr:RagB/SusD family nutrient uptake outer membrane protein [Lentimicrobium sp.]
MKTRIKLLSAAVALLITFTQCSKDFLDLEPQSELAISNAYNNATDAESALVGVYSCLADGHQNWLRMCLVDNFDDNVYAGGDDPSLFRIRAFQLSASNDDYIIDLWAACYNMINCANNVLKYVPEIKDPKLDLKVDGQITRRQQILGEATYLRAMKYFDLVRMFDGVPMPLTPTESTDPESVNLARTPGDQVYAQLIRDLEYCLTVLP